MTIAQSLTYGTARLSGVSDSPRLDAELLLAHVLRTDRVRLMIESDSILTVETHRSFRDLTDRRLRRVPVPYLTGQQEFFGLKLKVTPDVLIPRPTTELIVEAILKHLPTDTRFTIADIGTGSGAIALALAANLPRAKIIAADVSDAALKVAVQNAEKLSLASRVKFVKGSLLDDWAVKPEIIVANLPYLRTDQLAEPSMKHEPRLALDGATDGLYLVRRLINQIAGLSRVVIVALEIDESQIQTVNLLLKEIWPSGQIEFITDGRTNRGLLATNPIVKF